MSWCVSLLAARLSKSMGEVKAQLFISLCNHKLQLAFFSSSQRSLHGAPIFRLFLKVAVKGTQQCDFTNLGNWKVDWGNPIQSVTCLSVRKICNHHVFTLCNTLQPVWHAFSTFWLWSSVVSVLISVTTDMSPTGDLLVTFIFLGEVSFRACSEAFMCYTRLAHSLVVAHPLGISCRSTYGEWAWQFIEHMYLRHVIILAEGVSAQSVTCFSLMRKYDDHPLTTLSILIHQPPMIAVFSLP